MNCESANDQRSRAHCVYRCRSTSNYVKSSRFTFFFFFFNTYISCFILSHKYNFCLEPAGLSSEISGVAGELFRFPGHNPKSIVHACTLSVCSTRAFARNGPTNIYIACRGLFDMTSSGFSGRILVGDRVHYWRETPTHLEHFCAFFPWLFLGVEVASYPHSSWRKLMCNFCRPKITGTSANGVGRSGTAASDL